MTGRSLAERYARALLEVAEDERSGKGSDERIADELTALTQVFARGAQLTRFLESPQIPTPEKLTLLRTALEAGCARLLVNFLCLMVERHRVHELPMVIEEYLRLYHADRGIQHTAVTAARPLRAEERQGLVARLEAMTGRAIHLEVRVDAALVGGLVLRLDHRVVDGSLRRRLQELASALRHPGVLRAA